MKRRLLVLSLALVLLVAGAFSAAAQVREYEFAIITHSATIDFWIPLVKGAQDAAAMINALIQTSRFLCSTQAQASLTLLNRSISWKT